MEVIVAEDLEVLTVPVLEMLVLLVAKEDVKVAPAVLVAVMVVQEGAKAIAEGVPEVAEMVQLPLLVVVAESVKAVVTVAAVEDVTKNVQVVAPIVKELALIVALSLAQVLLILINKKEKNNLNDYFEKFTKIELKTRFCRTNVFFIS